MEQLNTKLYEKYNKLKKRKLFEEEWDQKRDSDLSNYQSATEDLFEALKNENERLHADLTSLREHLSQSEKLLLEESRKTKELLSEIGRLQTVWAQKNDARDIRQASSPNAIQVVSKEPAISSSVKKASTSGTKGETANVPSNNRQGEQNTQECHRINVDNSVSKEAAISSSAKKASTSGNKGEAANVLYNSCQGEQNMQDCCRINDDNSGDGTGNNRSRCAFHTLIESLLGMQFSVNNQADGFSLSVIHERSGYSFSLKWIAHENGGGSNLVYRALSLGMLERIAVDWMKEDIVFSIGMIPVFFQKISRVIGHS